MSSTAVDYVTKDLNEQEPFDYIAFLAGPNSNPTIGFDVTWIDRDRDLRVFGRHDLGEIAAVPLAAPVLILHRSQVRSITLEDSLEQKSTEAALMLEYERHFQKRERERAAREEASSNNPVTGEGESDRRYL